MKLLVSILLLCLMGNSSGFGAEVNIPSDKIAECNKSLSRMTDGHELIKAQLPTDNQTIKSYLAFKTASDFYHYYFLLLNQNDRANLYLYHPSYGLDEIELYMEEGEELLQKIIGNATPILKDDYQTSSFSLTCEYIQLYYGGHQQKAIRINAPVNRSRTGEIVGFIHDKFWWRFAGRKENTSFILPDLEASKKLERNLKEDIFFELE